MQPKSYRVFKWVIYALATLFLCGLQEMFFCHIRVLGLTPFLYPVLPAVVAMFEGPRHSLSMAGDHETGRCHHQRACHSRLRCPSSSVPLSKYYADLR